MALWKPVLEKVIFDTDTAVFNDDGAAMVMLLRYPERFDILGVTVVAGNHGADQGAEYMLNILEIMGRGDIPLYIGARAPIANSPERARIYEERFGKVTFKGAFTEEPQVRPPPGGRFAVVRPEGESAISFMIRVIDDHPGEITVLAIGPMTNLAIALQLRPDIGGKIKRLVFMGGNARVGGNVTPYAEFNFWFDPEAARAVMHAPIPDKIMFGLDITNQAVITKAHFDEITSVQTPITELAAEHMGSIWPGYHHNPEATGYIWDCLAAGYLIDPTFVTEQEDTHIEVVTEFSAAYGSSFVPNQDSGSGIDDGNAQNAVTVMLDLNFEKFFALYRDLLTRPV